MTGVIASLDFVYTPTAGPSTPSPHSQAKHSSDHPPMRVTSEMAA
jgi:hypothetical protein